MTMGLFGPSKAQQSRDIIARHAKQEKQEKQARAQRKADNAKYGRRGRGILCGWAADD
jgi:hypothetical protein